MKISVIIPSYNRAHLLPRAIKSVLAQSYQDWELVVVDDGSIDDTASVMQEFIDPRVTYLKLEKNEGVSAARNRGVAIATGEWVSFLDSDDAYLPDALATITEEARKVSETVGMIFFPIEMYKEDESYIGKRGYLPKSEWEYHTPSYEDLLLKKDVQNDMHRTYRTTVMRQYPFDERVKDYDTILYASIAKQGVGCLYVNKSVVKVYTGRGDHLSHGKRDPRAWQYIYTLYFTEHDAALRKDPVRYSAMCIGMASCCFKLYEPIAGMQWLWRGFRMSPVSFFRSIARNI